ncbi:thiamine pyrophosphate-binding protein [Paracoccus caeni]|uniref:Thiamine pyrophosphate-binding protein n=1 Tax=Paracoccus caeni TaxID=657651 RepID=A0A934VZK2_9RHOB|nr:thiamine pyrophosphate-binding protein [Paracoccus caeni]MBK4217127.1 thiamine pyrophosphate-binding protein [Paracoccus caeni]
MSAGVQRGEARTRLGRWWQDWRFHLSALAVLVPLAALPRYYSDISLFTGDAGLGSGEAKHVQVGPFDLQIAEFWLTAPIDMGVAGARKQFSVSLCQGCEHRIRAIHARFGKPRSLRAAGALFSGSHVRQTADLQVPPSVDSSDNLWLTVEEWDGTVHHGDIAVDQVSPATAAWLARKEKQQ